MENERINQAAMAGLSFGLTSGVITTLGLLVGLASGTQSRVAVIGGVITIALADSLSDALGVHISEESRPDYSKTALWMATGVTFISKLIVSLSFMVPILLLPLDQAVIVSVVWGLLLVSLLSAWVASRNHESAFRAIAEHLLIAVFVVIATNYIGIWVRISFA